MWCDGVWRRLCKLEPEEGEVQGLGNVDDDQVSVFVVERELSVEEVGVRGLLAVDPGERLPDGPDAVDVGVEAVERGVAGGDGEVAHVVILRRGRFRVGCRATSARCRAGCPQTCRSPSSRRRRGCTACRRINSVWARRIRAAYTAACCSGTGAPRGFSSCTRPPCSGRSSAAAPCSCYGSCSTGTTIGLCKNMAECSPAAAAASGCPSSRTATRRCRHPTTWQEYAR